MGIPRCRKPASRAQNRCPHARAGTGRGRCAAHAAQRRPGVSRRGARAGRVGRPARGGRSARPRQDRAGCVSPGASDHLAALLRPSSRWTAVAGAGSCKAWSACDNVRRRAWNAGSKPTSLIVGNGFWSQAVLPRFHAVGPHWLRQPRRRPVGPSGHAGETGDRPWRVTSCWLVLAGALAAWGGVAAYGVIADWRNPDPPPVGDRVQEAGDRSARGRPCLRRGRCPRPDLPHRRAQPRRTGSRFGQPGVRGRRERQQRGWLLGACTTPRTSSSGWSTGTVSTCCGPPPGRGSLSSAAADSSRRRWRTSTATRCSD